MQSTEALLEEQCHSVLASITAFQNPPQILGCKERASSTKTAAYSLSSQHKPCAWGDVGAVATARAQAVTSEELARKGSPALHAELHPPSLPLYIVCVSFFLHLLSV